LQREPQLLLRQTRKRFGAAVAEQSARRLDQIDNAQALEDLAEALLDSTDGAAWLQALTQAAG
jgi:plasmid maintenance system killer protein